MSEPNLADEIAARLRRDILRGKLPPGSAIKERDNALELGVSRTPMREAIRILAKEGLVILRPSRSPVVARPSFKEISDQVAVLVALEKFSAELACENATEADMAALRALNRRIFDCYDRADALDLFEIDMEFHTVIARASHNAALAETHRAYLARLWRARFLSASQRRNRDRVIGHHAAILDALEARDADAVRVAIERHLGNLAEDIRLVIEKEESSPPTV
ncbi:GntR family transcriptional regulator [Roseibium salinum]|uniref:GntR family transcriptional regulator n=1 Tax=Roseibium salinum TaxID=1604349 RepID=A0ABT3QVR7_9HYPH|nr:GntR family transcriptional regulator [Roseibium sp. DSM 29163]MCX2721011.1 GntR family transcriptional regulator [Roseibium sp. DSM 29163]